MLQVKVDMSSILKKKNTCPRGITGHGGYLFFDLEKDKKVNNYPVHQFVWECFHKVKPKGTVIVHIDGNKRYNTIVNLQLTAPNENDVLKVRLKNIEDILLFMKIQMSINSQKQ